MDKLEESKIINLEKLKKIMSDKIVFDSYKPSLKLDKSFFKIKNINYETISGKEAISHNQPISKHSNMPEPEKYVPYVNKYLLDIDNTFNQQHKAVLKFFDKSNVWQPAPNASQQQPLVVDDTVLECGPLQKSEETRQLEEYIELILSDITGRYTLEYDHETEEYILKPDNINMSVLVKKANLNHLTLSSTQIDCFQRQAPVHSNALHLVHPLSSLVAKLDLGLQTALRLYTDYALCNEFINSLQQFDPKTAKEHLLTLCFGAVALQKLMLLYDHELYVISEKQKIASSQLTPQDKVLLDFHERYHDARTLLRKDSMKWFHGDIGESHFTHISGFVSTSYNTSDQNIRILNAPRFLPTLEALSSLVNEHEVLLPPSGQYIIKKQSSDTFDMIYVNSPSFNSPLTYKVSHALRFAYVKHFRNQYLHISDELLIGKTKIARPNHGLPHSLRQLYLVKPIMDYFAKHAINPRFAAFCHLELNLELILLGLIFAVTGRESEISFADNPDLYRTYREASAAHFYEYAQSINLDEDSIKCMRRLVLFLGNPDFPEKINISSSKEYNEEDNFIFYVMTLAHKLDLPRCYTAKQWETSLSSYMRAPLVEESEEAKERFFNLSRYAVQLLSASHDVVMPEITEAFKLSKKPMRDAFFATISTSPAAAESVLEAVPRPALKAG
jgi:hypothetical protein